MIATPTPPQPIEILREKIAPDFGQVSTTHSGNLWQRWANSGGWECSVYMTDTKPKFEAAPGGSLALTVGTNNEAYVNGVFCKDPELDFAGRTLRVQNDLCMHFSVVRRRGCSWFFTPYGDDDLVAPGNVQAPTVSLQNPFRSKVGVVVICDGVDWTAHQWNGSYHERYVGHRCNAGAGYGFDQKQFVPWENGWNADILNQTQHTTTIDLSERGIAVHETWNGVDRQKINVAWKMPLAWEEFKTPVMWGPWIYHLYNEYGDPNRARELWAFNNTHPTRPETFWLDEHRLDDYRHIGEVRYMVVK